MTTELPRLLAIDDGLAIQEDVRATVGAPALSARAPDAGAAALVGETIKRTLACAFDVESACDANEAWRKVIEARGDDRPFAIAVIDAHTPHPFGGLETVEQIFATDPDIQVVLCTASADDTSRTVLARFPGVDRLVVLKKPFEGSELTLLARTLAEKWRLGRESRTTIRTQEEQLVDLEAVLSLVERAQDRLAREHSLLEAKSSELSKELQDQTQAVMETRQITVMALAQLAESRDPDTGEHLTRMQRYAQVIAEELSRSGPYCEVIDERFLEDFYRATPLHDIGKVGMPDSVLLKPGVLFRNEFEIMKRHTLIGAHALESAMSSSPHGRFLMMAADVARSHHERWDGTGYPMGLRGERIPLAARIAAVADSFDAITSARVYKDALGVDQARELILQESGHQFDPHVVDAFDTVFEELVAIKAQIDGCAPREISRYEEKVFA